MHVWLLRTVPYSEVTTRHSRMGNFLTSTNTSNYASAEQIESALFVIEYLHTSRMRRSQGHNFVFTDDHFFLASVPLLTITNTVFFFFLRINRINVPFSASVLFCLWNALPESNSGKTAPMDSRNPICALYKILPAFTRSFDSKWAVCHQPNLVTPRARLTSKSACHMAKNTAF